MTPKLYYSDITGQISHERVDPSQYLYHHDSVVKDLVEALRKAQDVMHSIRGGRTGSIGSIDNTYLPQLRKDNLDEVSKTIDNILGTEVEP